MDKVILVLLDGLNYDTGESRMGFMMHLVEMKLAWFYKMVSVLPSMSRPLYETILTGTSPIEHGIVNNMINIRSKEDSVFSITKKSGLKTGAAAYYWVSELYNHSPFDFSKDRIQNCSGMNIQHGIFYFEDTYPDSHVLADGEYIRKSYDPDFLLIHSMNIDLAGHLYSSQSKEYKIKAAEMDVMLSHYVPKWMSEGYHIIVTADHGMNHDCQHGGTETDERHVPLWVIGEAFTDSKDREVSQLIIAPTICRLLGMAPSEKMIRERFQGLK